MANKKSNTNNNSKYSNNKYTNSKSKISNSRKKIVYNTFIMKILVFFGVVILTLIIIYLMNYFFVKKNNLQINMSMDKKVEYITINNIEETLTSQKFVSDLGYSMRYDINNFSIFKYKSQDIYRFIEAEKIMVAVSESSLPLNCTSSNVNNEYNNCIITADSDTTEYYISSSERTYKIIVKTPNNASKDENVMKRINYMLNSFEIN